MKYTEYVHVLWLLSVVPKIRPDYNPAQLKPGQKADPRKFYIIRSINLPKRFFVFLYQRLRLWYGVNVSKLYKFLLSKANFFTPYLNFCSIQATRSFLLKYYQYSYLVPNFHIFNVSNENNYAFFTIRDLIILPARLVSMPGFRHDHFIVFIFDNPIIEVSDVKTVGLSNILYIT